MRVIYNQPISDVIYMFSAGTYECGFMWKSVRHTAKAHLSVALLPDEITLTTDPLTVDCSEKSEKESLTVNVTAMIQNSTEHFNVTWSYRGGEEHPLTNTCKTIPQCLKVHFTPSLNCNMKILL